MRHQRWVPALLTALVLLGPGNALGAANHPFLHASEPIYEDACGVARHDGLWVSSYYQDKINTPFGTLSPESTGSGPCKIELDAAGDLYASDWHEKVVKYSSSELLPGTGTVIDSDHPTGLAVETATGDVYVSHRTYIAKYSPVGALLGEFGTGHLVEGYGVAVSEFPATAGDLYVPDAATKTVKIFDSSGSLIGEMDGTNTPQGHFTYFKDGEIIVDNNSTSPSFGHIYVLDAIGHGLSPQAEAVINEFSAEGSYRGQIAGFTDAEPSGIAIEGAAGLANGNLYVTSGNSEGSQVFEYGPTSAAKALTVTKEGAGGGTVTTGPVGVVCGVWCKAEFNEGELVTLFANPDGHSNFAGWSVTGSQLCPGAGSCTVLMTNNLEVKASFAEPVQKTLSVSVAGQGSVVSSPDGIACPGSCSEHFAQGRIVTLNATPAANQRLAAWSGCEVQVNPLECKVTMSEAKAVTTTFASIPQLSLGVSIAGGGQGTVTSYPPGISCLGTCSSSFDEGSIVYLMAAPSPGSGFVGFSGAGCLGSAPLCAVPISAAQSVIATFAGAAAGPSTAHFDSFAIGSVNTTPDAALLTFQTDEPGTLVVFSDGTSPLKRELSAGTSRVRVALDLRARHHLSRRGHIQIRLALGFLPVAGGTPGARSLALSFHAAASKAVSRPRNGRR
jgi:hypothetical protein